MTLLSDELRLDPHTSVALQEALNEASAKVAFCLTGCWVHARRWELPPDPLCVDGFNAIARLRDVLHLIDEMFRPARLSDPDADTLELQRIDHGDPRDVTGWH